MDLASINFISGAEWNGTTQRWVWIGSGHNANIDTMACTGFPPTQNINHRLVYFNNGAHVCIMSSPRNNRMWHLCEDYTEPTTTAATTTKTTEPTTLTEQTIIAKESTTSIQPTTTSIEPTTTSIELRLKVCENGFSNELWQYGCYFVDWTLRTWDQAKTECESKGGQLAGINLTLFIFYQTKFCVKFFLATRCNQIRSRNNATLLQWISLVSLTSSLMKHLTHFSVITK